MQSQSQVSISQVFCERRFRRSTSTSSRSGRVRALVHPTQSDISPLLIIEAGYCGCPVISSRKFAISELVDDGASGLLLEDLSRGEVLASAMNWILEHEDEYRQMRHAAWTKSRGRHSKDSFAERLLSRVQEVLSAD